MCKSRKRIKEAGRQKYRRRSYREMDSSGVILDIGLSLWMFTLIAGAQPLIKIAVNFGNKFKFCILSFITTVRISSAVYALPEKYINIQMCTYILSQQSKFSNLGTHFLSVSLLQVLLTAKSNMPLAKRKELIGFLFLKFCLVTFSTYFIFLHYNNLQTEPSHFSFSHIFFV